MKKLLIAVIALLLAVSTPVLLFTLFYLAMTAFAVVSGQGLSVVYPLLLLGVLSGVFASTLIFAKSLRNSAVHIQTGWLFIVVLSGCLCGLAFEFTIHQVPNAAWSLFYGSLEIPTLTIAFTAYAQNKFSIITPRA